MTHYNFALVGFGNVGQALARLLMRKQDLLQVTVRGYLGGDGDRHRKARSSHRPAGN